MPYLLALQAKQFLDINSTFDIEQISENGRLGTNVLLDQRLILRWSSPSIHKVCFTFGAFFSKKNFFFFSLVQRSSLWGWLCRVKNTQWVCTEEWTTEEKETRTRKRKQATYSQLPESAIDIDSQKAKNDLSSALRKNVWLSHFKSKGLV